MDRRGCIGPPDLLVEVLSKRTQGKDRTTKLSLYEEAGVKEYWIVSPARETVQVFVLNNESQYNDAINYGGKDVVESSAVPGLKIALTDIFFNRNSSIEQHHNPISAFRCKTISCSFQTNLLPGNY